MGKQFIYAAKTKSVLFEGSFAGFRECLERAVHEKTDLAGADLRNRNLSNACLDDGLLEMADFSGANLAGANLSEAALRGATLAGCDLYNTCLAYADLRGCDFTGANFGATDIAGAVVSGARFSDLSCFSLDFCAAETMEGCRYAGADGRSYSFSAPPVIIRGFGRKTIVFSDEFWIGGDGPLPYAEQFHPIVSLRRPIHIGS